MNKIKVCIFREFKPDFVSRMIMRFTGAPYSHIAICYEEHGEKYLFHATGKGVHIVKLGDYLEDHILVGEKEVSLSIGVQEFVGYVKGSAGKDYSESAYIGIIFPYKWVQKIIGDGRQGMICSELVAVVLEECCGYELGDGLDFRSPKQIWEAI